jgi:N-acetylmuramoyl-L-alanine amidase
VSSSSEIVRKKWQEKVVNNLVDKSASKNLETISIFLNIATFGNQTSYQNYIKSFIPVKRVCIAFIVIALWQWASPDAIAQIRNTVNTVVIDAGHGGKDPGACGKKVKEKDVTLSVALKFGRLISDAMPEVRVVYTRTTDEFIELYRRAEIANQSKADLFISIHCNANRSPLPYGAETYVMGLHKTQDNLEVAKTENASILYEEDYDKQYEGFDPNSDEDYIFLTIVQHANIEQSIRISSLVQNKFRDVLGRKDRGVKQAGFWVLYKTTMPGILVEAGFLSNPEEEKFLASAEGKEKVASALFNAFLEYKKEFEEKNRDFKAVVAKPKESPPVEIAPPNIFFRVQFASFKKEKSLSFRKFKGMKEVRVYEHDGYYKYTSGNEKTLEKAAEVRSSLLDMGYKDAFIVAFLDERRISLEEAKSLMESAKGPAGNMK